MAQFRMWQWQRDAHSDFAPIASFGMDAGIAPL